MDERRSGYGGGRWIKWALLYVLIAAVVYAVIYFVFIKGGSGGSGGSTGGGYVIVALLPSIARRSRVARRFASWRASHAGRGAHAA
jgi:hypothetical protein